MKSKGVFLLSLLILEIRTKKK